MSEPEHSPMPWRDDGFAIKDAKDNTVCVYKFIGSTKQHCANRRLIVTAVNSHAYLLTAAYDAIIFLTRGDLSQPCPIVLAKLQAAIAKAEEGWSPMSAAGDLTNPPETKP